MACVLAWARTSRASSSARCRLLLPAGDQDAGRSARPEVRGLRKLLELCREEGIFGHSIYTRHQPLSVSYGMGVEEHDHEGRVITLEYDNFYLVTCYTPNSQTELKRLDYRMTWEDDFHKFLKLWMPRRLWCLRRPERGTSGDRYQESEDQPSQCRFYRRGAR